MTTDKPSIAELQRIERGYYAACPRVQIEEHEDDDGSAWAFRRR